MGPKIVTPAMMIPNPSPNRAALLDANMYHASRKRLDGASISLILASSAIVSPSGRLFDPRIKQAIGHIGQKIHHNDNQGREKQNPQQQGMVPSQYRFKRHLPHTRPTENRFYHNGSRNQLADWRQR